MKAKVMLIVASLLLAGVACTLQPEPQVIVVTATPVPATPTRTPRPATPTPDVIPGIDVPMIVRGVDLQLVSANLVSSVTLGGRTSSPTAPFNRLAVVRFETSVSDVNTPCEWAGSDQVNLAWKSGGASGNNDWGICSANTSGWVEFYFATMANGTDWVITFPGGNRLEIEIPF